MAYSRFGTSTVSLVTQDFISISVLVNSFFGILGFGGQGVEEDIWA